MRFYFNRRKAAQAAAYLIKLHGGKINLMALIKLLYFADRRALVETGHPITGDDLASMEWGMVLSKIYNACKTPGASTRNDPWHEYISDRQDHEVSLLKEADIDELCQYEVDLLDLIYRELGHLDQWTLGRMTHDLPEYTEVGKSSMIVDPEAILRAEKKSEEEIRAIASEADEITLFHLLAG